MIAAGDQSHSLGESEARLSVDVEDLAHRTDVGGRAEVEPKVVFLRCIHDLLKECKRTIEESIHKNPV